MRNISLRVPDGVVRAYDDADGVRSALMRRALADHVEDDELQGVDADLRTLALRDAEVDRGALTRKRARFRRRCYEFFREEFQHGAVTPDDAEALAETWRGEAALYGPEYVAFVDAIVDEFRERWGYSDADDFPEAETVLAEAEGVEVDVAEYLLDAVERGREQEMSDSSIRESLSTYHDPAAVDRAIMEARDP